MEHNGGTLDGVLSDADLSSSTGQICRYDNNVITVTAVIAVFFDAVTPSSSVLLQTDRGLMGNGVLQSYQSLFWEFQSDANNKSERTFSWRGEAN